MRTMALALVVLGGCSEKRRDPAPAPPPTPPEAPRVTACKQEAAKLGAWIKALATEGDPVDVSPNQLATYEGDASPTSENRSLISIRLSPTSVSSGGEDWGKPGDKRTGERLRDFAAARRASPDDACELIIDHDTPWSAVVATVSAIAPIRVRLMFDRDKVEPPPGPSAIDADIAAFLAADDAARTAMHISNKVFERCPPAVPIWSRISPGLVAQTLDGVGLAGAIEQCACDVDLDAVRRLIWTSTGRARGKPSVGIIVSVASSSDGAVAVTAKPDALWRDAHPAVTDAAKGDAAVFLIAKD